VILLDTTVLVYSTGLEHRFRAPCRALIAAVADGGLRATTTVEAIQEFVHVRSRRRDRREAASLGADYAELLAPLLLPSEDDLRAGLALFGRTAGLGAFDAVLAATGLNVGVTALVSADATFADVAGLPHIVPDDAGVAGLIPA
jgi:predicted nucleic acid-binding protein